MVSDPKSSETGVRVPEQLRQAAARPRDLAKPSPRPDEVALARGPLFLMILGLTPSPPFTPPMPWLALAALACLATILAGLCCPRARGRAAIVLVAACSACFGYGLAARDGSCTLKVENTFPAF